MMLLERQKEYRMAALKAKKQGDVEQAKLYIKTSKVSLTTAILSDLLKTKTVDYAEGQRKGNEMEAASRLYK